MKRTVTIGLVAASVALSGCSVFRTELKSKEVRETIRPGLTYRLPARQFTLTTTYEVKACQVDGSGIKLDADVKATLSERLVGAEAYTISYRQLDTLTKITNTEFRLSEAGLLTSINAGINDQTGAVIQNTASAATGIARAVAMPATSLVTIAQQQAGELLEKNQPESALARLNDLKATLGMSAMAMEPSPDLKDLGAVKRYVAAEFKKLSAAAPAPSCDGVNKLIASRKATEEALKAAQASDKKRDDAKRRKADAEAEIARLAALKDVYEALGKDKEKAGLMARLQEQEKLQAAATSELNGFGASETEKVSQALVNATAKLTITTVRDIVPKTSGKEFPVMVAENEFPAALSQTELFSYSKVELPKVTLTVEALTPVAPGMRPGKKTKGVAYRIPVAAMARVHCDCASGRRLLIEQATNIPQLGPIGLLDLKNGAFANNSLEVAFNAATGAPDKLVFHSKSRAEAASATAREAANAYLQLQKDKRDDILAANKTALDQQTALLTLEKTRNDVALAGAQANATAALLPVTTEQSLVAARIDLLRDQQRLDAVRTGTASTTEMQLEALVNQQKLLEQQLKILQIEQQIAEQKAKAQAGTAP